MITDSRIQVVAEGDGEVVFADATKIQVKYERTEEEILASFAPEVTTYELPRYRRTNQNTSITLKPIVLTGEKVSKGQILTEGYSTERGELALGRNLKVAFMPWKGYNFEDAIVISERIQREDIFTSVHVDEYIMEVRDTKRGVEELTSDIPNVSEDATKDLDANGIVRIGANIHPGDILIGKITPKGESDPSPEEKLLRAIFGDKAGDVKDASLKAQPSLHGVVIDTKLYSRAGKESKKSKNAEKLAQEKLDAKFASQIADLTKVLVDKLMKLIGKLPFLQLERPPDFTEGDGFGLFACVTSVHVSFYLHSQGIEHVGDGGVVYQLICRIDAVPFVKQVFYAFFISGIFVGFSVRFHGFPYICKDTLAGCRAPVRHTIPRPVLPMDGGCSGGYTVPASPHGCPDSHCSPHNRG